MFWQKFAELMKIKSNMFLSDSNSRKYCALLWSKLNNLPIVYDYEFDEEIDETQLVSFISWICIF